MNLRTVVLAPHQPKEISRQGYPSIETVDPRDGGKWTVLLAPALIAKCKKRGIGMAKDLAFSVRQGMSNPRCIRRIFHGVRDTDRTRGDDDYLCYTLKPPRRYFDDGDEPVPPNKILLVFLDDERVIYNFYWSDTCDRDENQPIDYDSRFINPIF